MSLKNRLEQYYKGELREKDALERRTSQERSERFEATRRTVEDLRVGMKLKEVRDDIWEEGEIKHKEDRRLTGISFELRTGWPVYEEARSRQESTGYNETVLVSYPATTNIALTGIKIKAGVVLASGEWDGKSVSINIVANDNYLSALAANLGIFVDDIYRFSPDGMVVDSRTLIAKSDLDKFDQLLIEACAGISSQYPLSVRRSKDRQEIIDRVLSGDLKRSEVPADFGYQFPPEPRAQNSRSTKRRRRR